MTLKRFKAQREGPKTSENFIKVDFLICTEIKFVSKVKNKVGKGSKALVSMFFAAPQGGHHPEMEPMLYHVPIWY